VLIQQPAFKESRNQCSAARVDFAFEYSMNKFYAVFFIEKTQRFFSQEPGC
jgi:hypothetical protein